ncbi:MAG: heparinase II/III family protein [Gemmatimonadales bacterium]
MLLLDPVRLDDRRAAAAGSLAPLGDSLAADLEPLLRRALYVPKEKALLSRAGGRCEVNGSALEFDPYSPDEHRCTQCGRTYGGVFHHRWWVYSYQLWLAERSVNAAALHLLRGDARLGVLSRDILNAYADAYASYPNRDNVLGPTRVFFSTYLESIWLLQLCIAADLLEAAGDRGTADTVRDRIARPSAALIAQYDEGLSNRQVWNNAALMAAALLAGDRAVAEAIVHAQSGVEAHLKLGLLSDGSWYEGENYHLFAHRGLWYCVTLAENAGIEIDAMSLARFREGFATPFATALPDFTLPSRKDSQYAISLRQPRFAELCELGLACGDDDRLVAALAQLYATDVPAGDTGRSRSTADVERNVGPARLSRSDLGWRSLLYARASLPPLEGAAPASAHLEGQGISVFRRERGEVYVALDWGQSGGGHGHPDRLNVLFAQGPVRWLDDLGTGSYVDHSLHWYRSTLAHNAPLVNGHSQLREDGALLAHDERGGVGWVLGAWNSIEPDVRIERALVVTPDYFVDELRWTAQSPARVELPIHFEGEAHGAAFGAGAALDGGSDLEDGFDFVRHASSARVAAMTPVTIAGAREGRAVRGFVAVTGDATWFRAEAPGQPPTAPRAFFVVRSEGTGAVIRSVWSWSPRVESVAFTGDRVVVTMGNERHEHRRTPEHWQVELTTGSAHSGIELTGWRRGEEVDEDVAFETLSASAAVLHRGAQPPRAWELGERHYRRSEETWAEAGRPSARVSVAAIGDELIVDVSVNASASVFVPAGAVNPYDNEQPDINGHGVQLYLRTPDDGGAWVIVPEPGQAEARVRPVAGWGALELRRASWRRTPEGFDVRVHVALGERVASGIPVLLDVLINETAPGRERRRGQLVLSGAEGEFVYLRGDRHDRSRGVMLLVEE